MRYQEIADAGFTFIVTGNYMADRYILRHACTVADDVGLEMILKADERLIFYDEPGLFGKIPTVGKAFEAYRQVNPERLPYTTLARGVSASEENLRDFVELVDPRSSRSTITRCSSTASIRPGSRIGRTSAKAA